MNNPRKATWTRLGKRAGSDKSVEIATFNRGEAGIGLEVDGYKYVPQAAPAASRVGGRDSMLKASLWLVWRLLMDMSFWPLVELCSEDPEARKWVRAIGEMSRKILLDLEVEGGTEGQAEGQTEGQTEGEQNG